MIHTAATIAEVRSWLEQQGLRDIGLGYRGRGLDATVDWTGAAWKAKVERCTPSGY